MHKQSVIQDRGCEYIAKICVTLQMRLVLYSSLNMFASKNHSHWPCKKLITVYTVTYDNSSEQEGGGEKWLPLNTSSTMNGLISMSDLGDFWY